MARIVVTGYMVRHPVAGNLLAFFHYVLGLHHLGHEVVYLEESGWPYSAYDPWTCEWSDHPAAGLRTVRTLFARYGLRVPVCYVDRETGEVDGGSASELKRVLTKADLLLNVGGVCWLPEFRLCRRRALIDMDPLFTQVDRFGGGLLREYHVHFSYGCNIGRPGCGIPTAGVTWTGIAPPVVLALWPPETNEGTGRFTTIANWGAYGGIDVEGEHYGQKDEEFLRIMSLPRRSSAPLELALSGADEATRNRLAAAGWHVRDPADQVGTDLDRYTSYIRQSKGEFSVAKNAYVKTRSGWFSDRSVCYLASARPVVVQDTGFTDWLTAGEGILAFSTLDEAADSLESACENYAKHREAALHIAKTVFSSDVVLPRLIERSL